MRVFFPARFFFPGVPLTSPRDSVDLPMDSVPEERIKAALELIDRYGAAAGEWRKQWVIDQVLRTLLHDGKKYSKWVARWQKNAQATLENVLEGDMKEDAELYSVWETGIPPM